MVQGSSGSNTAFAPTGCPRGGGEGERSATSASNASKGTIPNTTHFRWPIFGGCSVGVTAMFGVGVRQVASAVLADDGGVLDVLGAERALLHTQPPDDRVASGATREEQEEARIVTGSRTDDQ